MKKKSEKTDDLGNKTPREKIKVLREKKAAIPKDYKAKAGEVVVKKTADYQIILDSKKGEADLHFSLKNPVEDRYFAYALSLMDLFRTFEEIQEIAPREVVEDFITAIKVLKGMSETLKHKIEEEAGFKGPLIDEAKRAKIKEMLKTVTGKIEKEFPGAKVVSLNGKSREEVEKTIKDIINAAEEEMKNEIESAGKKKPAKKTPKKEIDLEGLDTEVKKGPSPDLEL